MFELQDKVVLITGGVSGIGLAIVKELARNSLKGIAIVDCKKPDNVEEFNKEFGDGEIFIQADICNNNQFEGAFQKTIEKFNQLDVVINNAAILTEKQWEKEVDVNLNGTVRGSLLALEYIQKYRSTSEGVVLNIASTAGLNISEWNPIYTATKHAVVALSQSLGLDMHYQKTKIKVITICPGATNTASLLEIQESQVLTKEHYALYLNKLKKYNLQAPSHVAKELTLLIKEALSGSVWIIENSEPAYEVQTPDYRKMKKIEKK